LVLSIFFECCLVLFEFFNRGDRLKNSNFRMGASVLVGFSFSELGYSFLQEFICPAFTFLFFIISMGTQGLLTWVFVNTLDYF
jgi:hypothetical protein